MMPIIFEITINSLDHFTFVQNLYEGNAIIPIICTEIAKEHLFSHKIAFIVFSLHYEHRYK
jgi:hypothetical protein